MCASGTVSGADSRPIVSAESILRLRTIYRSHHGRTAAGGNLIARTQKKARAGAIDVAAGIHLESSQASPGTYDSKM